MTTDPKASLARSRYDREMPIVRANIPSMGIKPDHKYLPAERRSTGGRGATPLNPQIGDRPHTLSQIHAVHPAAPWSEDNARHALTMPHAVGDEQPLA